MTDGQSITKTWNDGESPTKWALAYDEHRARAEEVLGQQDVLMRPISPEARMARAQVHATLALGAAVRELGDTLAVLLQQDR